MVCSDMGNCETIVGKFKIFRVYGENCKLGKYPIETNGGAPMPYLYVFLSGQYTALPSQVIITVTDTFDSFMRTLSG